MINLFFLAVSVFAENISQEKNMKTNPLETLYPYNISFRLYAYVSPSGTIAAIDSRSSFYLFEKLDLNFIKVLDQ